MLPSCVCADSPFVSPFFDEGAAGSCADAPGAEEGVFVAKALLLAPDASALLRCSGGLRGLDRLRRRGFLAGSSPLAWVGSSEVLAATVASEGPVAVSAATGDGRLVVLRVRGGLRGESDPPLTGCASRSPEARAVVVPTSSPFSLRFR